ncbi:flagellar type III secretion system protein FlhB [Hellea sp.]|nr:flagellar type III secretion system protein FlhB [Hellea sp.]
MSGGADNDGQEKNFDASESKIKKSRDKGDTPQSTEANTFMLYTSLLVVIVMVGGTVAQKLFSYLSAMLTRPSELGHMVLQDQDAEPFKNILGGIAAAISPVFVIPIVFIFISLILQQAIVVAPDKLKPKLSRISPISNAKQKYGPNGMVEFLKRFAKLSFISAIAGLFFYQAFFELSALSAMNTHSLLGEMKNVALKLTFYMLIATMLITLIDLPYARFAHMKKLRMTLQEVKDESKENEGDPHMKRARRMRAQEISKSNMLRDVAKADVIIVNPTHYAIALEWSRDKGAVPVCVAKGVDEMAMRIRERAKLHDIPIHSDPPCARSLHAMVEIGEGIKPEHYAAVAAAIHFADKVRPKDY